MQKPKLTVDKLLAAGFTEIGCWELNDARDLSHAIELPKRPGVYAFVIDGVVQYVRLASRSLHQRLNFHRKPGSSQRTNVRLNEIIRGHLDKGTVVQILVAHPSDAEWNGLRISGPEGLEAALICDFEIPWNVRGAQPTRTAAPPRVIGSSPPRQQAVAEQILELVERRPGLTELEIAKAVYGPSALQPQVNAVCRKLVAQELLERRGAGHRDPFVYYLKDKG